MTHRILASLCLTTLLITAGCMDANLQDNAAPVSSQKIALSSEQQASVRAAILARLKDPGSAQFGSMSAAKDIESGVIYVCGMLNARNSFGGFTGNKFFTGALSDIPGLTPIFMPLTIGGTQTDQEVAVATCRRNGVF